MKKKDCVIVIPVHKADPEPYELISFEQCYRILGSHSICVVTPHGLDLSKYTKVIPCVQTKRVDPVWFSSLLNYNKLKLSRFFYQLFPGYEYLLTYELDAFIFKDNLDYWCSKEYDYVGAPWFQGWDDPDSKNPGDKLVAVGNSGFSLRKISAIKKGLRSVYYADPTQADKLHANRYLPFINKQIQMLINRFSKENATIQNATLLNEDWIIAELMAKKISRFKVPPVAVAAQFAFEVKPGTLLKINNYKLPMGCHAWWRYDVDFWKPYIENFGYKLL